MRDSERPASLYMQSVKVHQATRRAMNDVRLLWVECIIASETLREGQQAFEAAARKAMSRARTLTGIDANENSASKTG